MDDLLNNELEQIKRTSLLPVWIKVFAWIFGILGLFAPVAFIIGLFAGHLGASIYGIEATSAASPLALLVLLIFVLKTTVAFGLLRSKSWGVKLGILDAVTGIIICCLVMLYSVNVLSDFTFRLEIILLIPYLVKLLKIRSDWENAV